MAQNGSDQPISDDQQHLAKTVKAVTVIGAALIFSPVLIIFSPVLVPAYFFYWIYRYVTGKQPIGAAQVDQAREKIVETAEEVKKKVEKLGQDIVNVDGKGGEESIN